MLAHLLAAGVQPGEGDVGRAVVVPRQVGVDAVDAIDGDAVAPRAGRVGRGEHDASARAHRDGDDDVEHAVAVPDGRRPDAAAGGHVVHAGLLGPGRHVADVRPGDQVGAAVDRYPGQVLEGRGDQVVHAVGQDDARIRAEAGDQRVRERHVELHLRGQRQVDSGGADPELVGAGLVTPAVLPVGQQPGRHADLQPVPSPRRARARARSRPASAPAGRRRSRDAPRRSARPACRRARHGSRLRRSRARTPRRRPRRARRRRPGRCRCSPGRCRTSRPARRSA